MFGVARVGALVALALTISSHAHSFPTKPVTIVIGFAANGPSDLMVQAFAGKLEQRLGQPVVIENRAGAGGNIAAAMVARAPADGHTLLLANTGILAANASLYKKLNYEADKDFAPISLIAIQANVLVIHPSLPVRSSGEFISYVKAYPGKIQFSSGGVGSTPHLVAELFKSKAGIDLIHVPFRGTSPALQELVEGRVQMTFASVSAAVGHVERGEVRALGVSTIERIKRLPDVPTIAQVALPGFEASLWHCLVAPAGIPEEVVATLHNAIRTTLSDPSVTKSFTNLGLDVAGLSPQKTAVYVKSERAKWSGIIRNANIAVE